MTLCQKLFNKNCCNIYNNNIRFVSCHIKSYFWSYKTWPEGVTCSIYKAAEKVLKYDYKYLTD